MSVEGCMELRVGESIVPSWSMMTQPMHLLEGAISTGVSPRLVDSAMQPINLSTSANR